MQESNREKWMELCGQAGDEQDPEKLAVQQLSQLLTVRRLLKTSHSHSTGNSKLRASEDVFEYF